MKKVKSVLFLLTCCFVFIMGCKQTNNGAENSKLLGQEPNEADTQTEVPLGLKKYDENISITFLRELSVGLQELVSHLPEETIDKNRWTDLYKDELGINVNYKWTSDGQYYNQQLNYAITSGHITDVMRVNPEQLRQLNNAGLIQDLTTVFEKYATPYTKSILSEDAIDTLEVATINGRLMALPEPDFPIDRANFIWLRTDWLEALQLSPPKTIEDVNNIAIAFAKQDPDQNGIDDTFGLALTSYLFDPVMGAQAYMAGFNAFPELWIVNSETGELEYGGIQQEIKAALLSLQQLYKDKIIDEEFSLKNGAKVKEAIQESKIGLFYGEQWGSFNAQRILLLLFLL